MHVAVRHHDVMNAAPDPSTADDLSFLVGMRLYSVVFVMDYAQLLFDGSPDTGATLTCHVRPTVETSHGATRPGDLGYADALVSLIPGDVVAASVTTGAGLRVELASGAVVLNPTRDEVVGPEIAMLSGIDGRWWVWRPGEDGFDHLA